MRKTQITQMHSCEICKIFKSAFFYRVPAVAASVDIIREDVAIENSCQVPTKLNPADISTRKAKLAKINKKLWWTGSEICLDFVKKCP